MLILLYTVAHGKLAKNYINIKQTKNILQKEKRFTIIFKSYLNPCLSPARLYGQYGSVPPEVSEIK
jgi:hypothetical protein